MGVGAGLGAGLEVESRPGGWEQAYGVGVGLRGWEQAYWVGAGLGGGEDA